MGTEGVVGQASSLLSALADARSVLFVPGDRRSLFDKAARSGAGAIVLDLEDAVAPAAKDSARAAVGDWLGAGGTGVVRINGTDTEWHDQDVAMVARQRCPVMVPKVCSAAQLAEVAARLPAATELIALIETAAGVLAAAEISAFPGVVRTAFGSVDLAADLGINPEDDAALAYARSALVLAAAASGKPAPLDGVTTVVDDDRRVEADAARAMRLGFGGKLCIHPRQVGIVNIGFSPSAEEVTWARRVVGASEGGVTVVDGQMVDEPVIRRAMRILAPRNGTGSSSPFA